MILNKKDEVFEYADKKYQVGEMVIANNQSDYVGLVGIIAQIVTGEDKDTDNPYPDIYCDFIKPPFKDEIKILEENFSKWYGNKKKLEDLNLDGVIMAPCMIEQADKSTTSKDVIKIYLLTEDWAFDGDEGIETVAFTDFDEAKLQMRLKMYKERREGCVETWLDDEDFVEENSETSYEAYIEGYHCENHYTLTIKPVKLPISENIVGDLNFMLRHRNIFIDFRNQVEDWDELLELSEEEYERFINDSTIPYRVTRDLEHAREEDLDRYHEAISEVAHELLAEYIKRKKEGASQ